MRFTLCAIGETLALALTLLLIIPASIHPLALGCVPLLLGTFVARARVALSGPTVRDPHGFQFEQPLQNAQRPSRRERPV